MMYCLIQAVKSGFSFQKLFFLILAFWSSACLVLFIYLSTDIFVFLCTSCEQRARCSSSGLKLEQIDDFKKKRKEQEEAWEGGAGTTALCRAFLLTSLQKLGA